MNGPLRHWLHFVLPNAQLIARLIKSHTRDAHANSICALSRDIYGGKKSIIIERKVYTSLKGQRSRQ